MVDDFGRREVRLTDEPFEKPPGEAVQQGTVTGVLGACRVPDRHQDDLEASGRLMTTEPHSPTIHARSG